MSDLTAEPLRIFYSYSHKDERLRKELERHLAPLKRQKIISGWHDRDIVAGALWDDEIKRHLKEADIILLLVSADFMSSEYCWDKEMEYAMARHKAGTARVIPILLRPTNTTGAPFMQLQGLPRNIQPVTSWKDRDSAWINVAEGIRQVAQALQAQRTKKTRQVG